jgi:GH24 family phage-related lysozyme (muramidase)
MELADNSVINQAVIREPETQIEAKIDNKVIKAATEIDDMKFLNSVKPRIRIHEGVKLDKDGNHILYKDSLGKMTGGIGHLITKKDKKYFGKPEGTIIDIADVERWEQEDAKTALQDAKSYLGDNWKTSSNAVKEVATNMAFNLGRNKLSQFKGLKKALISGDMKAAANEILFNTKTGEKSKYAKQVGTRAEDLAGILLQNEE